MFASGEVTHAWRAEGQPYAHDTQLFATKSMEKEENSLKRVKKASRDGLKRGWLRERGGDDVRRSQGRARRALVRSPDPASFPTVTHLNTATFSQGQANSLND